MVDSGAADMSPVQPQVSDGTNDNAGEVEVQTGSTPNPATMASGPTPGTVHARERSRSPRRHDEEPFGLSSVHLL